jgi:hypothetical protein
MMSAKKHCRYLGPDQWSPLLKQARLKVEIYKLAISMARTEVDSRIRIDKLIGIYGNLLEIPNSVDKIQRFLRVAQLELKAVILDASASRRKFLQAKQTDATIASNPKEALKWKNIQRTEEIKAMLRSIYWNETRSTLDRPKALLSQCFH